MANIFKPKRSSTASSVPTTSNLADGELAVNSSDKKIYLRDGSNIIEVANYTAPGGISTDAQLLDGLDSTQFLRSDVADTKTSGNLLFNNNVKLRLGSGGDLNLYHNGGESIIENDTGSGDLFIKALQEDKDVVVQSDDGSGGIATYFRADGSTGESILYHYGTQKLATKSNGIDVTGHTETDTLNVTGVSTFQNNVHLLDNDKLLIGGSVGIHDGLEIYHDSNHSYIDDSGTGNLYLRSGTLSIQNLAGSKTSAVFQSGSSQEFYFNNSKKFETTGVGVTVTGDLIVSNDARVSGVLTVGQSSVTINGTDNSIHGYDVLIAPPKRDSTVTITVTVATKTTAHRYYNTGSTSGYVLNGVESPFLTLTPGRTYKFDQSDSSNSGHPLRFYRDVDKNTLYSTGVTNAGTPGSTGAYTQIVVSDTTPTILHYQCSAHVKMGNSLQSNSEGSSTDASSGTYGDARYTPQITVDASGRITGITEVEIFSTGLGSDLDLNSNSIIGTGNINITGIITASGNINANGNIVGDTSTNISGINSVTASTFHGSAANMTGTTAVGGGTYGSSSAIPVITVDGSGRITGISPVAVSGGGGGGGGGTAGVTRTVTSFTATAGQTTFNVNYTVGTIDVFLNGVRLNDSEFTATTGTTVVLATGASVDDIIDVAAYSSALGIEVKNNGTLVGTATTINFTTDLNTTFSNGTATVASTASGGGGGGISEATAIAYAIAL